MLPGAAMLQSSCPPLEARSPLSHGGASRSPDGEAPFCRCPHTSMEKGLPSHERPLGGPGWLVEGLPPPWSEAR